MNSPRTLVAGYLFFSVVLVFVNIRKAHARSNPGYLLCEGCHPFPFALSNENVLGSSMTDHLFSVSIPDFDALPETKKSRVTNHQKWDADVGFTNW